MRTLNVRSAEKSSLVTRPKNHRITHFFRFMDSGAEQRLHGVSETECGRFDCLVLRQKNPCKPRLTLSVLDLGSSAAAK